MENIPALSLQAINTVVKEFLPDATVVDFRVLSGGHINVSLLVRCQRADGRVESRLLQRLNVEVFPNAEAVMENIRLCAEHLPAHGYPLQVLRPLPTVNGTLLHDDGMVGGPWRLFPFFENTRTLSALDSTSQAWSVANAFGTLAACLASLPPSKLQVTIPDFHNGALRRRQLMVAAHSADAHRRALAAKLLEQIESYLPLLDSVETLHLPRRIAHHDAKVSNVLFDSDALHVKAIVDWDTLMPGRWISDFGDLVRTAAVTADENEADFSKVLFLSERYEALLDGYQQSVNGLLSVAERRSLPLAGPWLTLMQAVRFLCDFLSGDVYYPTSYPNQNLQRALNQWTLFVQMKFLLDRAV